MEYASSLVKLRSVQIQGLKGTLNGRITVHGRDSLEDGESDVVGIFGPNGSGKTAVIDALLILGRLMEGKRLPEETSQWIRKSSAAGACSLACSFLIGEGTSDAGSSRNVFSVSYRADLGVEETGVPYVLREKIRGRQVMPKTGETSARDWAVSRIGALAPIGPDSLWRSIRSRGRRLENDLIRAEGTARAEGRSVLFSERILSQIRKKTPDHPASFALSLLQDFARNNLYVVDRDRSEMTYAEPNSPTSIANAPRYPDSASNPRKTYARPLEESGVIPSDALEDFSVVIDELNTVIGALIPDFAIEIDSYPGGRNAEGAQEYRFELQARRAGVRIPLRYESDGIRRIVFILTLLIAVYNDPGVCVLIDDMDAGIFEHLLGQLLESLSEGGAGQLIFTSHNLRAMETLEPRQIVLTTTDPYDRYTTMRAVRPPENNRDRYYTYLENYITYDKGLSSIRIEAALKRIGEIWKNRKREGAQSC